MHSSLSNDLVLLPTIQQHPKLEDVALDGGPGSMGQPPGAADDWVVGGKHDACQQGRRDSSLSSGGHHSCNISIAGRQHKGYGPRGVLGSCCGVCCYWQSLAVGLPVAQSLHEALCMTAGFEQDTW